MTTQDRQPCLHATPVILSGSTVQWCPDCGAIRALLRLSLFAAYLQADGPWMVPPLGTWEDAYAAERAARQANPAPVLPTLDHPTHVEPHQNRRESGASSLQPLAAVAAILTTLALTAALQRPTPAGRHYHPMPLAQMAHAAPGDPIVPTHVVTAGTVRMVRQEADGDLHVRLCAPADPRVCIVLECIPELPCKAPSYGDHVTAQGISRWDTAHRWQEIHPVLSLEVDR